MPGAPKRPAVEVMLIKRYGPPGSRAPVRGGVPGGVERALHVRGDDRIPLLLRHVEEHAIAQDAGHVHDDVETAVRVDGLRDHRAHRSVVGDVGVVGAAGAAGGLDLVDDLTGGARVGIVAVERDADVVHHDRRPLAGQADGDRGADATAGAGDDRHSSVEVSHAWCPFPKSGSYPGRDRFRFGARCRPGRRSEPRTKTE